MKVIAKTDGGVLIEASDSEVKEILKSVSGKAPNEIEVGQKIPALDYASTVTKAKALKDAYSFTQLEGRVNDFNNHFNHLKDAVYQAADLDL